MIFKAKMKMAVLRTFKYIIVAWYWDYERLVCIRCVTKVFDVSMCFCVWLRQSDLAFINAVSEKGMPTVLRSEILYCLISNGALRKTTHHLSKATITVSDLMSTAVDPVSKRLYRIP